MSLEVITGWAKPLPPALINRAEFGDDRLGTNEPTRIVLPPPPPASISEDKVLESVYYNSLAILSRRNRCSDFFGGPAASMEVFNQFVGQARKDYFSPSIAMRMHGDTINAQDSRTKTRYRMFTKVSINANGPFYKSTKFSSERTIYGVGTFAPNTREVRVLILLHELGHLMRGEDGEWLLPDDGGNEQLSRRNSLKIEEVCGDQIKGLREVEALRNLAMRKQPEEKLALDRNNVEQSPIERTGNH
jgi:hypothetical protein